MSKIYQVGDISIAANDNISFNIKKGEFVVILGASGAGKSTLLNIIGGMDTADKGEVIVDGKDIAKFSEKELTEYRRYNVGFVFQFYNLIPNLTALENVEIATEISNSELDSAQVLNNVGLGERLNNFPSQLSGGEQQRTAIARALAKQPDILLCDEPTGALDYNTGKQILELLRNTSDIYDTTVLLITHNQSIAPMADKVIEIKDSKISDIIINDNPKHIDEIEW